jgi:transaldolase
VTKLHRLHRELDQSPWLDDLPRAFLLDGTLAHYVEQGIRGVTANPTILAKAIEGSDVYDDQLHALLAGGASVEEAYWDLVIDDVERALTLLRPVFDESDGTDGFVSIEVAPELAHDTEASLAAARDLYRRIDEPNLMVKIPATDSGLSTIESLVAEGHNVNVTLIFSLDRYRHVVDAYLRGLEKLEEVGGDLGRVNGVASFFVSRVDTEVDRRLEEIGQPEARALRGAAAVAQAKIAYQIFRDQFCSARWARFAAAGAHPQRLLWASTSTKNPDYADTLYVDELIGPDTVNTLAESTVARFEEHGTVERTLDHKVGEAQKVLVRLSGLRVDLDDVGRTLEAKGVAAFHESFEHVLHSLEVRSTSPG